MGTTKVVTDKVFYTAVDTIGWRRPRMPQPRLDWTEAAFELSFKLTLAMVLYVGCLVGPSYDNSKPFFQSVVCQWSCHSGKYGVRPIHMLVDHHGRWYLLHPGCWFFHFSSGPPYTLTERQTLKTIRDWCILLYESLCSLFLNTNFLSIPYFLLDLTCFLTTTRSPVPNYLTRLPLLCSSLCLRIL